MPLIVFAAPFLICDPQVGVVSYALTSTSTWVPTTVVAQSDGSIKMDVSAAPVGTTSLTVAACTSDVIWGVGCSAPVPFSFVRPPVGVAPTNIKLLK